MTQEALKLALEWAEANGEIVFAGGGMDAVNKMNSWVTAIKEALAQPEQEPVAWQLWVGADTPLNAPMGWQFYSTYDSLKSAEISARTINSYQQAPFAKIVPLYTSSPQRTWVGLTDDEIWSDGDSFVTSEVGIKQFARAIEAKLKEKNT